MMFRRSNFKVWDKKKIKSILPQGEPFIFIDKVINILKGKRVVAIKNLKKDEYFFKGHFPGNPIMPGVLMLEAMGQAAIILFCVSKPKIAKTKPVYYLCKVQAEFFSPVYPGDSMLIEAIAERIFDNGEIVNANIKVKKRIVVKVRAIIVVKKR